MTKVMIFGGRDFDNYSLLKKQCDLLLKDIEDEIIIISGTAKGADSLGEKYAAEKGYKIESYPAKWDDLDARPCIIGTNKYGKYNKLAGMNRNKKMTETADMAIAFWNGKSRGTANSIQLCGKNKVKLEIIKY